MGLGESCKPTQNGINPFLNPRMADHIIICKTSEDSFYTDFITYLEKQACSITTSVTATANTYTAANKKANIVYTANYGDSIFFTVLMPGNILGGAANALYVLNAAFTVMRKPTLLETLQTFRCRLCNKRGINPQDPCNMSCECMGPRGLSRRSPCSKERCR